MAIEVAKRILMSIANTYCECDDYEDASCIIEQIEAEELYY